MSEDTPLARTMKELTETLGTFLQDCVEKGFSCPLYVTCAARNGSALIVAYWPNEAGDGLDCEVIAKRFEPEGFRLPIAVVAVGANAEAAYMRIETQGGPRIMTIN